MTYNHVTQTSQSVGGVCEVASPGYHPGQIGDGGGVDVEGGGGRVGGGGVSWISHAENSKHDS